MYSSYHKVIIALLPLFLVGCHVKKNNTPQVTSVSLSQNKVTIQGKFLDSVTEMGIEDDIKNVPFQITSKTANEIQAYPLLAMNFILSKLYQLTLWNAQAEQFPITVEIPDGSVTSAKLATPYVPIAGGTMTGALNLPTNGLIAGTDQLVISGGNVGIGTASPGELLHMKSTTGSVGMEIETTALDRQAYLYLVNDARTWVLKTDGQNFSNDNFVIRDGTATADRLVIDNSGNVGIGTTSPAVKLDVDGELIRTIQRASGSAADDTDSGALGTRILQFNKKKDSTSIRIAYTDAFRVIGLNSTCTWDIRVDGAICPGGSVHYSFHSNSTTDDVHTSSTLIGYCDGVSTTGNHVIQVYVTQTFGSADCYTGHHTRWTLEAQEVH